MRRTAHHKMEFCPVNFSTSNLTIRQSRGRGRGVFAARRFRAGECIEICPVVLVPIAFLDSMPSIQELTFEWARGRGAMALGFGSLYNHSQKPNARYDASKKDMAIMFTALVDIPRGREIFVNYNGDPDDRTPVWFESL